MVHQNTCQKNLISIQHLLSHNDIAFVLFFLSTHICTVSKKIFCIVNFYSIFATPLHLKEGISITPNRINMGKIQGIGFV
ncbi:MAG: hypothetical protein EA409_04105 [Saprospirales bacterium]|nr:MAG: hypothetical protein EA409_04105 [Saprospirales bacterium]